MKPKKKKTPNSPLMKKMKQAAKAGVFAPSGSKYQQPTGAFMKGM